MGRAVQNTQAVELGGGQVLAVGWDRTGDKPVAELWDPSTNTWRRTDSLNKNRSAFSLVALKDGRALLAGGINDATESFSSAYVLDPTEGRWAKVGLMDNARTGAAAAVMSDGRVLMVGGSYCTGVVGVGEVVLAAYHRRPPAIVGQAERVFADTGPVPRCRALATAEVFDPRTGAWSRTSAMRYARAGAIATPLGDGRVLVWGTRSWSDLQAPEGGEIYDPATARFTPAPAVPVPDRAYLERFGVPVPAAWQAPSAGAWETESVAFVPLPDGDALLAMKGWLSGPWEDMSISRWLRFDTRADAWLEVSAPFVEVMDQDRATTYGTGHPDGIVAALRDGRVLFAGGEGHPRAADVLAPSVGAWSSLPQLPADRWEAEAVTLADGSVLVIGTALRNGKKNDRAFRFLPAR
ncbi:MAG TPA: kelch repeat-containing protein [Candidatus Saccharimonadia bacterium]|nr:kelch repeat-containing protein [Candidatus Saccharimonadia bacterium]